MRTGATPKQDQHTIRQIVINGVVLRRQLGEEQLGQVRDPNIWVFQALRHLTQLALDLDHPVQNQMGQHHERVLLDHQIIVGQPLVQLVAVLVDDIAEGHRDVTQCDDGVTTDARVLGGFQDLEQ